MRRGCREGITYAPARAPRRHTRWLDPRYTRVGAHAVREAAADQLLIGDIWNSILGATAEIIEDYPNDPRGPSCLVYCEVAGVPQHVVVAYPSAPSAQQMGIPVLAFMLTCYRPEDCGMRASGPPISNDDCLRTTTA